MAVAAKKTKRTAEAPARITGRILAHISAQALSAGDRMPSEREFAERFRASRAAVGEALARLEAMRVIERRPNSGIYLGRLDADSSFESLVLHSDLGLPVKHAKILQSMEVRQLLELQAVRLACQRRSEEDIAHMRAILADTESRLKRGLSGAEQDQAFHMAIVAATQNGVLVQVLNAFYRLSLARRKIYFSDPARARRSLAQHRKILVAIEDGDAAAGMALMNVHIGSAESYWRTVVRPVRAGDTSRDLPPA
jgi:GntR family transcriptional regulator, transcriptional repressor for pyruvate dehydrogenase complex